MKNIIFKFFLVVQGFILLLILYRLALNGRYFFIENSPLEVDKWTNTIVKPNGYEKLVSDSTIQEQNENQEDIESEDSDNWASDLKL